MPLFNLWTLGWNVGQLLAGHPGYWDAPVFWPAPGAFAYSNPQPPAGVLAQSLPYLTHVKDIKLATLAFV